MIGCCCCCLWCYGSCWEEIGNSAKQWNFRVELFNKNSVLTGNSILSSSSERAKLSDSVCFFLIQQKMQLQLQWACNAMKSLVYDTVSGIVLLLCLSRLHGFHRVTHCLSSWGRMSNRRECSLPKAVTNFACLHNFILRFLCISYRCKSAHCHVCALNDLRITSAA